jgi:hypothetical protein
VPGDPTFDRRLVHVVREHGLQDPSVEHPTGQVLRTRHVATLDQDDRKAALRKPIGGDGSRRPGPDDDDVEVGFGSAARHGLAVSAAVSAGTTVYRSPTMP